MAIADKVKKIVAEQLDVEIGKIEDDARFIEDLGADSLAVVEMVLAFEGEFGVNIPDEVTEKMVTVADVIAYVQKHAA
jgi:acyl carrier protein